jgi:hypothetical protein
MRQRWSDPRALRGLLVAALVGTAAFGLTTGTTSAQLTQSATASVVGSTRAACASGAPYATALTAPAMTPTVWWRFSNLTGAAAVPDSSGNGNTGTASGTGLTFGAATVGLITCDTTYAMRQAGAAASTGFVVLPTSRTAPTTFSIATWILSNSLTGGRVVGFGDAAVGGSTVSDRALLFNRTGQAVFQMRTAAGSVLLTSPARVTNNVLHLVVATETAGTGRLYVDGVLVASSLPTALLAPYTGYWRAGWDQNVATIIPTARNQATTRQDEVAIWEGRALTAGEVSALYASNHW